jgi:hypothetical protein
MRSMHVRQILCQNEKQPSRGSRGSRLHQMQPAPSMTCKTSNCRGPRASTTTQQAKTYVCIQAAGTQHTHQAKYGSTHPSRTHPSTPTSLQSAASASQHTKQAIPSCHNIALPYPPQHTEQPSLSCQHALLHDPQQHNTQALLHEASQHTDRNKPTVNTPQHTKQPNLSRQCSCRVHHSTPGIIWQHAVLHNPPRTTSNSDYHAALQDSTQHNPSYHAPAK